MLKNESQRELDFYMFEYNKCLPVQNMYSDFTVCWVFVNRWLLQYCEKRWFNLTFFSIALAKFSKCLNII